MTALAERLADVDRRIADAARAVGRDPAEITRIVVTKFQPASLVRELAGLGVRTVAENRQQEFAAKASELADLALEWHFVGQVQTNKARAVRRDAAVVHSVDRIRLAEALAADDDDRRLDILVQVNLTTDPARGGVAPADLPTLVDRVLELPGLRLRGIMAVAPVDRPASDAFAELARHAESVRSREPAATWISAGMTGDFTEAVAAGATHLRIGSAITGPRPDRG